MTLRLIQAAKTTEEIGRIQAEYAKTHGSRRRPPDRD